jgi:hypothetical protein
MDRDEAIKLLKRGPEGVAEWNRQRATEQGSFIATRTHRKGNLISRIAEPHVKRLLREAHAFQAHYNVSRLASLQQSPVDLSHANLSGADVIMANLSWIHLSSSNLSAADLHGANLYGADLSRANLSEADLSGADLNGANLDGACCQWTVFGNVDLSLVTGLDRIEHLGPSIIGIETLLKSWGRLPTAFLRGCGVPDALIEYLPSLIGSMSPIQFYSCFISYSTKDDDFAKRLHSRMVEEKLRVWYAPEELMGGRKTEEQIDLAIRIYDKLLLVLSEASMNSEWVKTEISKARSAEARDGKRKLFPIRLVPFKTIQEWRYFDADIGKDSAKELREYHIPDFSNWKDHDAFEAAFARLLADLKRDIDPSNPPS